jgi:hypothetical protein
MLERTCCLPVPSQKIRAGFGRKTSEISGTWKQYSHRKFFGFFPMICDRFSVGKHRKLAGIHRKKILKIPIEILLPLPAISGAFLQNPVTFPLVSCMFWWDPVAGMFELGFNIYINMKSHFA